jgi:hypothetical protein
MRCVYKWCSKVSRTSRKGNRRTKRRRSTTAKIRAIQRRYISGSDLCPFFHRFLSLSGERERERERGREEPFGHSRERQDERRASPRTRSNGVRNAIETIVAIWARNQNLGFFLKVNYSRPGSVPEEIPWILPRIQPNAFLTNTRTQVSDTVDTRRANISALNRGQCWHGAKIAKNKRPADTAG